VQFLRKIFKIINFFSATNNVIELHISLSDLYNKSYRKFAKAVNTYRLTQKKFATPTITPTNRLTCGAQNLHARKKCWLKCISLVNTYRLTQKKFATPTLTDITLKSVYRPHNHILWSRVYGAFQSRFAACISPFPFGPFSWVTCIWCKMQGIFRRGKSEDYEIRLWLDQNVVDIWIRLPLDVPPEIKRPSGVNRRSSNQFFDAHFAWLSV